MPPAIRSDPDRPSGGYAILEGDRLAEVKALTIENVSSGLFLSDGGRWGKLPYPFPVEAEGQALRLGPAIVDHVPEDLQIALRSSDGRELGRLIWQNVMPSRGRRLAAPAPEPAPTIVAEPLAPESPAAGSGPDPKPQPAPDFRTGQAGVPTSTRRALPRAALAGAALVILLAAFGAFALLHRPAPGPAPAPAVDHSRRCADGFAAKVEATRAGPDEDRVKTAEMALASGCGAQALAALDGVDWEMNESAAWRLARFYDPNETDPIVRDAGSKHPDWAATYYAYWASRAPRAAAALRLLCKTDAVSLDANAQLKRACGR